MTSPDASQPSAAPETDRAAASPEASRPAPAARVARVAWIAGSRGEVLTLGPALLSFDRRRARTPLHWFLVTGENGMAVHQALDYLGLIPDEDAPVAHPADEPAVRLNGMLALVEAFVRQRKATHMIFTGWSPTAAGAALYAHARGCPALWLKPPDPAGLIPRLRWEAGLERIIRACAPCVQTAELPATPEILTAGSDFACLAAAEPLERALPGLREGAPLVAIAVLRRDWGYLDDATSRLARAAAAWAAAWPGADFLVISNLNARIEGPLRSLPNRPANLLQTPPLPYPLWRRVLGRAALLLTDSPLAAAEARREGVAVAALGEAPAEAATPGVTPVTPAGLSGQAMDTLLQQMLRGIDRPRAEAVPSAPAADLGAVVRDWLAAQA